MTVSSLVFAVLSAVATGQADDLFARWKNSNGYSDSQSLDQLIYVMSQLDQWPEVRKLIERRKALGGVTTWVEIAEGDLYFAEDEFSKARNQYQNSLSRVTDLAEKGRLEERIRNTDRESLYRQTIRSHSAWARWLGWASIALLLGLPMLLPFLWKQKGPGFPGPA